MAVGVEQAVPGMVAAHVGVQQLRTRAHSRRAAVLRALGGAALDQRREPLGRGEPRQDVVDGDADNGGGDAGIGGIRG